MSRTQLNYTYRGRCGHDRMVVGFTTTYAISAYHHCCELEFRSWRGVLDTTLYDKVCQWLTAGRWFSPGTTVSPTNKTDCNDINEILLEVALTSMTLTLTYYTYSTAYITPKTKKHKVHVFSQHWLNNRSVCVCSWSAEATWTWWTRFNGIRGLSLFERNIN